MQVGSLWKHVCIQLGSLQNDGGFMKGNHMPDNNEADIHNYYPSLITSRKNVDTKKVLFKKEKRKITTDTAFID